MIQRERWHQEDGQGAKESFTEREAQGSEVGRWVFKEEDDGSEDSQFKNEHCEQAYTCHSLTADVRLIRYHFVNTMLGILGHLFSRCFN